MQTSEYQAQVSGLLQTIADNHPDFFRQLQFKHEVLQCVKRIDSAVRLEEAEKLKAEFPFAAVSLICDELKRKYADNLDRFDAVSELAGLIRKLMPEAPKV